MAPRSVPVVLMGLVSRMETGEEARVESETKAGTEPWTWTWELPGFEAAMDNTVGVVVEGATEAGVESGTEAGTKPATVRGGKYGDPIYGWS